MVSQYNWKVLVAYVGLFFFRFSFSMNSLLYTFTFFGLYLLWYYFYVFLYAIPVLFNFNINFTYFNGCSFLSYKSCMSSFLSVLPLSLLKLSHILFPLLLSYFISFVTFVSYLCTSSLIIACTIFLSKV